MYANGRMTKHECSRAQGARGAHKILKIANSCKTNEGGHFILASDLMKVIVFKFRSRQVFRLNFR